MRAAILTALGLLIASSASVSAQEQSVDFVTEILPIFESRCIECHQAPRRLENGRMKRPKGRVRLDSVEAIRASKRGELIVPGKPDASIVLDVISLAADHDDIMPPTSKGPPLSSTEIESFRRWIRQGARFGDWTSFQETSSDASGAASISKPNKVLPPITALAFTPDGKSVVAASQRGLQVLAWPTLAIAKTIEIQTPNLHDLTFSRSGDRIAIGGGDPSETGLVEVLSWPTGEAVRQVGDHDDSVFASAFRSATELLSASLDKRIVLWDLQTGNEIRDFQGHSRGVTTLCCLPDKETFVSGSLDHSLRVWNADTGALIRSLSQHTGAIHDLALHPGTDGLPMVASSATDRTIRFWQPTIGRMIRYIRLPSEALAIAWVGDETMVASCRDGKVRVINTFNLSIEQERPAVTNLGYALALHPTDGSVAVGGVNGEIRRVIVRQQKR